MLLVSMAFGSLANCAWTRDLFNRSSIFAALRPKFSKAEDRIPIAYYEDVKALTEDSEKLLVDVREPNEIQESGKIPHSINIPLGMVAQALSPTMSADNFLQKYGRQKPDKETEIIFHCRLGMRSLKAAQEASKLGFSNVKTYEGSWKDWAEKENLAKA